MKQKLSATIVAILCAVTISMSTSMIPQSASLQLPLETSASEQDNSIIPYAEQTKWYLRNYNGMLQKRLWSITEGRWLTDWIDVAEIV